MSRPAKTPSLVSPSTRLPHMSKLYNSTQYILSFIKFYWCFQKTPIYDYLLFWGSTQSSTANALIYSFILESKWCQWWQTFLQTAVGFQFNTVICSICWTWLNVTDAFSKSPSTVTINLRKSLLINSKCTDRCVNLKCQRILMMSDHFSSLQLGWQLWFR